MLVWKDGKEPTEVADYDIDWTLRLSGDTISSATWSITVTDGSLAIQSHTNLTTLTKVWLTGGTAGYLYELQNTVITANNADLVENVQLLVAVR